MSHLAEEMAGPEPIRGRSGTIEKLRWRFPIPRPHAGVPLGNGLCGALVWGRDRLCVTVSRAGVTRVFPATPPAWRDMSFQRIRVPGPFLVGGVKRNGRMVRITVQGLARGAIRLDVPSLQRLMVRRAGRWAEANLPVALTLRNGETIELREGKGGNCR